MKVYKIQNVITGKFSTGGMSPKFTKNGKIWTEKHYVYAHIKELVGRDPADVYNDCMILEADITDVLLPLEPANKYLIEKTEEAIEHQSERLNHPENSMTSYYEKAYAEYIKRRKLMR